MPREKDGWLVCDEPRGGGRCGGRIASIDELDLIAPTPGMEGRRVLHTLPGWRPDSNRIYYEPPSAFDRRQRRGFNPRRMPSSVSQKKRARAGTYRAPMFEPTRRGWILNVRCSECQHVHELNADALGVLPLTPHSLVTEKEHKPE